MGSSIQASSWIQDEKIASLEALESDSEQFIEDVVRIDRDVSEIINQRQDDSYDAYKHLKPDCEKNGWECFCKNVGEWCKEHWQEISTALGMSTGTALTITTAISLTTAGIVVFSTMVSSALNIIDTWYNIDNATFKSW